MRSKYYVSFPLHTYANALVPELCSRVGLVGELGDIQHLLHASDLVHLALEQQKQQQRLLQRRLGDLQLFRGHGDRRITRRVVESPHQQVREPLQQVEMVRRWEGHCVAKERAEGLDGDRDGCVRQEVLGQLRRHHIHDGRVEPRHALQHCEGRGLGGRDQKRLQLGEPACCTA